MDPIQSFSGISTGIQWRDLVDQLASIDTRRRVAPLQDGVSSRQKQIDAWNQFQTLVARFQTTTQSLADGTAFSAFAATAANSPTSGRALLTATADSTATAGTYRAEVVALASAAKLSSRDFTSTSTALGLAGDVAVNGTTISVLATDTLASVRDKINAVNAGATTTRVTATILTTGANSFRLQLTSDRTGADGIRLLDGAGGGVLKDLGIVDGSLVQNISASGAAQTDRFASASATVASQVGLAVPAAATITVGGRSVSINLATDSLDGIAAKIVAAGGTASVTSGTANGTEYKRLSTNGTVSASTTDGTRALELLGFLSEGRAGITQVVTSANTFTDPVLTASSASLLTNLTANGTSVGIASGDTFTMAGTRGDGTTVNMSFTVGATDTVQTVLNKLNDATTGFARTGRTATASFVGGKFVLTDGSTGDSQLALSLTATTPAGVVNTLGAQDVTTVGRQRQLSAGTDSQLRLDGVLLSRSTNSITDAVKGLTLSLQTAEVGTTIDLTIARDTKPTISALTSYATAYNEIVKFADAQRAVGAPLSANSVLRSSVASIRSTLLNPVGVSSTSYNQLATVGVAVDKFGMLMIDEAALTTALANNPSAVTELFATTAIGSTPTIKYLGSTAATVAGNYAVNITTLATQGSVTGSGFTGTYTALPGSDTMTIVDAQTGKTSSITLTSGDTLDGIVTRLNTAFGTSGAALAASRSGNNLVLKTSGYGTPANFTVSYTVGTTADATAQLGVAAGTYSGGNVAGTIGGLAATGLGQSLTGATGGATSGLALLYTGTATGAVGSINLIVGAGTAANRAATLITTSGTGTVAQATSVLQSALGQLTDRIATAQQLVETRRQSLIAQFTAMEAAVARIQSQGARFSSQIASISQR